MAKEASFDNLIQAIQQAFIRVNDMSEEQQLCLVPISSLKLDEIEVDFKVQIYGKVSLTEAEQTEGKAETFLGYVPHGGKFRNREESYANIKLKFVSQDPPEGLMRIRDQFVKVTI